MKIIIKRRLIVFCLLLLGYAGTYIVFRQSNIEVWEVYKSEYVIFPEDKILYYLYRPIVLVDGKITGMRFHIGPHQ